VVHARPDRVDPHKHSHTAAVLDQRGELLAQQRFPASREGHRALRRFAKRWPQRRWAIEGAAVGRVLAQQLVTNGEQVIDVPAKLAARVRELSTGHGRKHDTGDAVSIALAAQGSQRLHQVDVEDQATVLRLLSDRRDDLVATRTQTLYRLLAELVPAGADRHLTAEMAAALLRRLRPTSPPAKARRQRAVDLVRDVHALDQRITTVQQRLHAAVTQSKTTLVELVGIGPMLAAKSLGEVGDIGRTRDCAAMVHRGAAEASSLAMSTCSGPTATAAWKASGRRSTAPAARNRRTTSHGSRPGLGPGRGSASPPSNSMPPAGDAAAAMASIAPARVSICSPRALSCVRGAMMSSLRLAKLSTAGAGRTGCAGRPGSAADADAAAW
jgi:hypothetical protein